MSARTNIRARMLYGRPEVDPWSLATIRSMRIVAEHFVAYTVETEGVHEPAFGPRVYDVAGLVDEREVSPQVLDLNVEILALGFALDLLERVSDQTPHLLRIKRDPL